VVITNSTDDGKEELKTCSAMPPITKTASASSNTRGNDRRVSRGQENGPRS